ncbi:MAG TPA: DNA methyltransferase [Jatrophihabitans sp.]|nr:DNA methyltransferase [Jatrophihabitans sp.]
MIPYHDADGVTLYRGDALAVLADLETASVDALITDPPYSSGGFTRGDRTADVHSKYVGSEQNARGTGGAALGAFGGDNRDQRGMGYWCALWLGECLRVVKPGGAAVLFTDWRQLPIVTDVLQAGGFVWRGIVPWVKLSARPQAGRFTSQCEYVVWGTAGARPFDYSEPPLPGFYQAAAPRDREHITQKPVDVMRGLVKIAPEGGVVLDPFMGAGTTGVAAALERREFVGVELTDHYAEVAQRRIVEAAQGVAASRGAQPSMFGDDEAAA